MPEVMNVEEVAEWLKVDKSTVTRQAAKGKIPGKKVGKQWRFNKSVLQEWFGAGLDSLAKEEQ